MKKLKRLWAAIEKETGEVWMVNHTLKALKEDLRGGLCLYRFSQLVEKRRTAKR